MTGHRLTRCVAVAAAMIGTSCAGAGSGDEAVAPPAPGQHTHGTPGGGSPPAPTTATTAGPEPGAGAWSRRSDAPVPVTEIDAEAFGDEIWTVGGFTAEGSVAALVQIYHPATDTWRRGPDLPVPVHHAAVAATPDTVVVIGGYRSASFDAVDDVWVLDPAAMAWRPGPPLPEPRGAGAAAWDGERVVFAGGTAGPRVADEVWALPDVEAGSWQRLGALSIARDHLDATSDGTGTVWFLGGRQGTLDSNLGAVDAVRADRVELAGELPTPRGGVAAFFSPAHGACLAGGEDPAGTFAEVECLSPDGRPVSLPALADARHGAGAAVVDGVAYVVLGGPRPGLTVSATVEALNIR